MDFKQEKWTVQKVKELNKYIEGIKQEDKIDFTKKTVNTNMDVLGIPIPILRKISKEIFKGNYQNYLDLKNNKYYENTIINACLTNEIKDFEKRKHYLDELYIDNWSTCDVLSFKIKGLEKEYWNLSMEYLKSEDAFKRRVGIRILFSYKNTEYIDKIFEVIDKFYDEEEYYVNMSIAWLICELMIYNREKTLKYLKQHHLNKFTVNKAISKCRDSYRISKEDKEILLKYRQK